MRDFDDYQDEYYDDSEYHDVDFTEIDSDTSDSAYFDDSDSLYSGKNSDSNARKYISK